MNEATPSARFEANAIDAAMSLHAASAETNGRTVATRIAQGARRAWRLARMEATPIGFILAMVDDMYTDNEGWVPRVQGEQRCEAANALFNTADRNGCIRLLSAQAIEAGEGLRGAARAAAIMDKGINEEHPELCALGALIALEALDDGATPEPGLIEAARALVGSGGAETRELSRRLAPEIARARRSGHVGEERIEREEQATVCFTGTLLGHGAHDDRDETSLYRTVGGRYVVVQWTKHDGQMIARSVDDHGSDVIIVALRERGRTNAGLRAAIAQSDDPGTWTQIGADATSGEEVATWDEDRGMVRMRGTLRATTRATIHYQAGPHQLYALADGRYAVVLRRTPGEGGENTRVIGAIDAEKIGETLGEARGARELLGALGRAPERRIA